MTKQNKPQNTKLSATCTSGAVQTRQFFAGHKEKVPDPLHPEISFYLALCYARLEGREEFRKAVPDRSIAEFCIVIYIHRCSRPSENNIARYR